MKYQPTLDSYERCETADDRTRWLVLKYPLELSYEAGSTAKYNAKQLQLEFDRAHLARLRLIYTPFPVVRRIGAAGSAMTWAGTIVGDTMSPANVRAASRVHGGYTRNDGLGDQRWDCPEGD